MSIGWLQRVGASKRDHSDAGFCWKLALCRLHIGFEYLAGNFGNDLAII